MTRLAATLATIICAAATLTLAGCSAPSNNPCYWHNGVQRSHITRDGHTLLLICSDGTVIVKHQ